MERKVEKVTLYLPPDLARRLRLEAVEQGRKYSDLAAAVLDKHLPAHKRGRTKQPA